MSLGDHLEELRARLILAILGLLAGTILSLFFGKQIIGFIERPYNNIIQEISQDKARESIVPWTYFVERYNENLILALNAEPNDPNNAVVKPDIDPNILTFLNNVYVTTTESLKEDPQYLESLTEVFNYSSQRSLQALAPADAFLGYMRISLITGLLLSSPWVFYQLWMFVAAGLYANERRYITASVPFSAVLFVSGALFFMFVIAPLSLKFFLLFGDHLGIASNWTFEKYISFVTLLMLVFGLGFQTPIVIFVLNRTGLVSIKSLKESRKIVIIVLFAIAAFATPPDVISQISLAIPLYALFELGILISWYSERKRKQTENK